MSYLAQTTVDVEGKQAPTSDAIGDAPCIGFETHPAIKPFATDTLEPWCQFRSLCSYRCFHTYNTQRGPVHSNGIGNIVDERIHHPLCPK